MAATTKFGVIVRNMSASAATASQSVRPPVQVFGIEGRYATALYSAATRMNQLDKVEKDLIGLQSAIKSNINLRETLVSPIINRKVMGTALTSAAKKLNMADATSNILQTLAENGRLKKLNSIINSFKTIMAAHRGDIVCEVVTAKPLESGQQKELEAVLKKFIKPNEKIKLTSKVDPSLIGGMIVSIGDKFIDMSISSKVKMYSDLISTTA